MTKIDPQTLDNRSYQTNALTKQRIVAMANKRWPGLFILAFLLTLGWPAWLQAQEPANPAETVVLTDEQGEYPLGLHMEFLEDESGELAFEAVSSLEMDSMFIPSEEESPSFGFTDSIICARFWAIIERATEALLPVANAGWGDAPSGDLPLYL